MERQLLTLLFIEKDGQILLGMKKRGFGMGRWNGFGGKLLPGEKLEAAAIRETLEEAGVKPLELEERGVLDFEFVGDPIVLEVHVFKAASFEGEPHETEEMVPKWFAFDEIPYKNMWSDDPYWLPALLEGKRFKGGFLFDEKDQVLSHSLVLSD